MIAIQPIFAQVEASASTGNSTGSIIVVGFVFVMVVLAVLAAVTSTIGAIFSRQAAQDARKALEQAKQAALSPDAAQPVASTSTPTTSTPSPAKAAPEETEDTALLAVIAAAVHSVIGERPHRVISIRTGGPGWAQEGRRQIFSSHRTR